MCFPELDDERQRRLVRDTFIANGIGILETATGWCRDPEHLRHRVVFEGQEHMARVQAEGKGALIIGIHFSTLDLGGALHSLFFPADVVYRPHDNALFERFMTRARNRIFGTAIDRHDLRGVVRRIKSGHHVWYSPDQDFGREASVFAPFFGVEAATIKLTAKIARMTGAPVMPLIFHRNPDDYTYRLEYLPALEDFPSGDEVLMPPASTPSSKPPSADIPSSTCGCIVVSRHDPTRVTPSYMMCEPRACSWAGPCRYVDRWHASRSR